MKECCNGKGGGAAACAAGSDVDPMGHFPRMIPNCLAYAKQAKAEGRPIVGMMCEFTPRELIMAAGGGGVAVCLCGGSAKMIPPAEQQLPTNLCPLIKSTYGYHVTRSNPFLEMADLIVAETTCDGKKKMFELMGETRPMYVLELPQKADDADAMRHWYAELVKLRAFLEKKFGTVITDERLRGAMAVMNRERKLRRDLAELMMSENPPLTGRQLLEMKSNISGIPGDFEQYEKAVAVLSAPGERECRKNRVRVLMTGVPMVHGAERVIDLVESQGGLVVCMENCTGVKPILEDTNLHAPDPLMAVAEKYFHLPCSVMTKNTRRIDSVRALAEQYRAQCVIDLVWQACLTYDVESFQVRRMVEQELKLPYLRIETDYSPSDSARIQTRVEALFETVKQRRSC